MDSKPPKKSPYPKERRRVHKSFTLDPEVFKKLKGLGHNTSQQLESILKEHFERVATHPKLL